MWQRESRSFERLAMLRWMEVNLTPESGEPRRVVACAADPQLFDVMGVAPRLGRVFAANGADVVISERLARQMGEPVETILGTKLRIDSKPYQISGVLPGTFRFCAGAAPDVWMPIGLRPEEDRSFGMRAFWSIGRLRSGITVDAATAELTALAQHAPKGQVGSGALVVGLAGAVREPMQRHAPLALCLVLILFAMGCSNIVHLQFAGLTRVQRDLAVRLALGAKAADIRRMLLVDLLSVSSFSMLIAAGVLRWASQPVLLLLPGLPVEVDGEALTRTCMEAAFLCSGLAFAVVTAATVFWLIRVSRTGGLSVLGAPIFSDRDGTRLRQAVLASQVAVSAALVALAVVFGRSLLAAEHTSPGYTPEPLVSANIVLASDNPAAKPEEFLKRSRALAAAVPGVKSAAIIAPMLLTNERVTEEVTIRGQLSPLVGWEVDSRLISPNYFQTLGLSMRAGRELTEWDLTESVRTVVINEIAATRVCGARLDTCVGTQISVDGPKGPWLEVVGISQAVREDAIETPMRPTIYFPYTRFTPAAFTLLMSTAVLDPRGLSNPIQAALRALDPDAAATVLPLRDKFIDLRRTRRTFTGVLMVGGLGGLLVTLVGVFAVGQSVATASTRQVALRLALGAGIAQAVWAVGYRGILAVAIGLGVGLAAAAFVVPYASHLLYGVQPLDGPAFGVAAVTLALVACGAMAGPLLGLARRNLALALRHE
jgi:predicted permease